MGLRDGACVVGAAVVGVWVCGESEVGVMVSGLAVVGIWVCGESEVGAREVGVCDVGFSVAGDAVVGDPVVGLSVGLSVCSKSRHELATRRIHKTLNASKASGDHNNA
jgi:hypothetical protein